MRRSNEVASETAVEPIFTEVSINFVSATFRRIWGRLVLAEVT